MRTLVPFILVCATWVPLTQARIKIGENIAVVFASVDQGKLILTAQDDFVRRMSPFDRAARMKTDREISEKTYLEFVGKSVLPWSDLDKQKITSAFDEIQASLEALSLPFPREVFLIKTTGDEEGGAAYTRANAVVFPKAHLTGGKANLQKAICHELFHILSRAHPDLREEFYAAIGFDRCDEVAFPLDLTSRKITNPDAPKNDHCIRLKVGNEDHWAIPILFSRSETYDVARGGPFFNYLQFEFLLVERDAASSAVKPLYEDKQPRLVGMQRISGFFEQVGRNTRYIIHPEEILADNFALLVMGRNNLPSPAILKKLEEILENNRIGERENSPDKK